MCYFNNKYAYFKYRESIGQGEYLYDTVIFNKEHLYSKIFTRARKTYITCSIYQGVFYPLMKPSPTPLFWGGYRGQIRGGYTPCK
jgi:hypothetical protein